MKKFLPLAVVALFASSAFAGEHYVSGHTTKNGTYVSGHYATNPNGTTHDNWSTIGNVNPHTGRAGTKQP